MARGRIKLLRAPCVIILGVMGVGVLTVSTMAADPSDLPRERATREIYVPFSDLHVLLEHEPKRVLLSRSEYDDLVMKARKSPETHAPLPALVVAADYAVTTEQDRAHIQATLTLDVLDTGLHALPLDLGGVGLQEAKLDNRNAPIGRGKDANDNRLILFVEGVGRHELQLTMVAPVATTAAQQTLTFRLPRPAAAKLHLTALGDVEVKGGADVVSRVVDEAAKVTRFELLPRDGDMTLVMTLNSHLQRQHRAVVARSVLLCEVTQAYEKLHATTSLAILYQAVDQFQFVVPDGFEITEVASPSVARWDVRPEGDRKLLHVQLREKTTETVVLHIAAIRAPSRLEAWRAPRLEPLDVVGSVAVVGLLVENRLKTESLSAEGLIPIDASVLSQSLPAESLEKTASEPALRAVAAWYAPQSDFTLTARYVQPPAEMAVTTSLLLVLADKGQEVFGGLSLLPRMEKRFTFDVAVPTGWQITSVTDSKKTAVRFEHYPASSDGGAEKVGRIRVVVPAGMPVGEEFKVNFRAVRTPPGWLARWSSVSVDFPMFVVLDATRDEGAIAVDVRDDMTVRPDVLSRLTPLAATEKAKYGLADVATTLAYRYEGPKYAASMVVERTQPRVIARTFSFLRVDRDALNCHYELIYTVEEARTQQLAFLLPNDTPASLSIRALDGVAIKEYTSESLEQGRRWTVLLADSRRDRIRLAVDFQQPMPSQEPLGLAIPLVRADGVAYQSGSVGVEGCAELDVRVDTPSRRIDVGELAEADYQPGKRLLGAYGFVGEPPIVKIDVARNPGYPICSAIAERCELDTNLSPDGQSQTQARFHLRTKAAFVQVELPTGAELWSAQLNGEPLKLQRQRDRVLIDLPAGESDASQTLQIVYAASVNAIAWRGDIGVLAPKLLLRARQDDPNAMEIPLADLVWRLHVPSGYEVVRSNGTVVTEDIQRPVPAVIQAMGILYYGAGGHSGGLLLPAVQAAREVTSGRPARVYAPSASRPMGAKSDMMKLDHSPEPESVVATKIDPNILSSDELTKRLSPPPAQQPATEPAPSREAAGPDPFSTDGDLKYSSSKASKPYQSLAGVRSLKINLAQTPEAADSVLSFRSLGVEPELAVTLVNRSRFSALAWGLALAVGLAGMAMTRRTVLTKFTFLFITAVAATLLPLATDSIELSHVCNAIFNAVALLVPYYLVIGLVRLCWNACCRASSSKAAPAATPVVLALLLWGVLLATCVAAADAPAAKPQPTSGPYVIQVVDPTAPVKVPDDAVLLPYDPDAKNGIKDADKLLVPYDKYVELWNQAHPDKKIETTAAPAPYAMAGAEYKTTLEGDESLLLSGQMEFDVFGDTAVQIPLRLGGGVLAQAQLDGKPARLSVATAETAPQQAGPQQDAPQQAVPQQKSQAAAQEPNASPASLIDQSSLLVLHAAGKGRHTLQLAVRLKLARQGGWRVVQGVLPAAPATGLTITVPTPQTELRLAQRSDPGSRETLKPNEEIHTAIGDDGSLSLQWRPKVAEGQVDQSLTAASTAVLDVQEDGLRLNWQIALEFRRSQRDRFSLALPPEFLVEKVEGNNVRGWEVRKTDAGQAVDVVLLQPAKDRERFSLVLWRAGAVGGSQLPEFDVPLVSLSDASLHNGQVTIRRSPLIELRTLSRSGVTRTDVSAEAAGTPQAKGDNASPLGIRPFEAYSFSAVPFAIRLAAAPIAPRVAATVQTVLRIAEYDRALESRITFDVQNRPIYQLQMLLPPDLQVDHVSAPGEFQYAVTQQEQRPLLTIYLADGLQGTVPVLLRGRLGRDGAMKELSLPNLQVLGVDRQQGDVAVQVDPAFDVDAADLRNCEKVLLSRLQSWLEISQQQFTRLALHYAQGDHAGTLRLTLRKADVVCDTITNVRVTDRAIEATILLDFDIHTAGIHEFSFLLPAAMADSRISVPMLRQKTIEPLNKEPGAPVRVKIELQDEVMDQLRILVENDCLLTPGSHEAPIPTVELGRTNRRFVAIESAGRDVVQVENDNRREMDVLGRQQKEWEMLKGILGREMTMAYLVDPDARQPRLAFHTEEHAAVETVGARIGLAETTLVLDANGAYRAQHVLHIDNRTEQFLTIRLPEGASLWTAQVAGEPVKPTTVPDTAERDCVRIPLIKTAAGDLYYDVILKYGGRMPRLGTFSNVTFPLIHCENIREDLSQVQLFLPEQYRWFNFGGTMRPVATAAELRAGYIQFQTQQTEQIVATLRQGDQFAKLRAASNLKTQKRLMDELRQTISPRDRNSNLESELQANSYANQQAEQEVQQIEQSSQNAPAADNRKQLANLFQVQKYNRAKNVITRSGAAWTDADASRPEGKLSGQSVEFDRQWLGRNQLAASSAQKDNDGSDTLDKKSFGQRGESLQRAKGKQSIAPPNARTDSQPSANQVGIESQSQNQSQRRLAGVPQIKQEEQGFIQSLASPSERSSADRYKERLDEQSAGGQKRGADLNGDQQRAGNTKVVADRLQAGNAGLPPDGKPQNTPGSKPATPSEQPIAGDSPAGTNASVPAKAPSSPPPAASPEIEFGGMGGGMGGGNIGGADESALTAVASTPSAPTGLASLDFELPQRGLLRCFTVPRGEAQVTAQACSGDLLQRLIACVATIIATVVVWLVVRWIRSGGLSCWAKPAGSTLLICLGLLSLCTFLPVLGLIAFCVGCSLKMRKT